MSLNHIVQGGLKDLALDVKSLSIQGQTVNPGGGGNPFNQSLNTTDAVEFASVNMQDLQSSASLFINVPAGVLTIVTPGININSNVINTNSTITTTKPLTLDNQLATKEQVEILIDTIVPDLINLQPLEQKLQNQSASSAITNFDGALTASTSIATPIITATNIYPTTTSLKLNGDLAGGASDTYIQMNSTDMNIVANSDITISTPDAIILQGEVFLNNTITTAKTTFTNNQELITKKYVDDAILPLGKTVVLFNQSVDYLVVNGGFYTDGNITLGWDATTQTEFLVNTLPATGDITVSSLNGATSSSIVATQQNFKYDIGGSVLSGGVLQSWVHSNTDATYPNYYITILRVGGCQNSILTVERY